MRVCGPGTEGSSEAKYEGPPRSPQPVDLSDDCTCLQKCRDAGQMPVHAAAREGSLPVLQYLFGVGFSMTGGPAGALRCLPPLLPLSPSSLQLSCGEPRLNTVSAGYLSN